ncbi:hypothetical protein EJ07DRAFT_158264 [Lizonia empirigonia]|nr:hypothetical protein EJ07DRAFT_158264 [Lizonia empirigonia]
MQFEPILGNLYHEYKYATNDLVQWVASTARATGTVNDLFNTAEPTGSRSFLQKMKDKRPAPSSFIHKLKGKRRAQTKSPGTAALPATTEISYKTLARLGKAIASSEETEVPYRVLVAYGAYTKSMHKHNKWRRRIIRLLDELLLDLQCQPPSAEQVEIFDKILAKSHRADSIFEDLEGVEIAKSLYYNERIEIPKTKDRIVYRLEQCNEDIAFATYCFFQDLTYIRMFSARAWREFNLGAIGIQTATYCTNIAYAKIKEICVSFTDTYERFRETGTTKSHPKIDSFFRNHCGSGGDFTDVINPCCEDDSFARNAKRRLGFYISTLACSRLTHLLFDAFIANPGQFWGNVQDDRCLVKSLHQLGLLLGMEEFLPTVCRMDYMHLAAVPVFTGVNGSLDTDSVFAAQMLWDIQHEIDTQGAHVEDIIIQVGEDLQRLYMDHTDEWLSDKLKLSHGSRTKRISKQLGNIRDITEDFQNVHSFQAHMESAEKSISEQCPIPGFHLLRHVPLLVGQLMAHYRFELQDTFMDIANDHGHILIAIHLYNAAKKSGALQRMRWEDMEWFIHRQAHDRMFAGDPPAENSEYASRFCLVHGLDPTNFSLDRKHTT